MTFRDLVAAMANEVDEVWPYTPGFQERMARMSMDEATRVLGDRVVKRFSIEEIIDPDDDDAEDITILAVVVSGKERR